MNKTYYINIPKDIKEKDINELGLSESLYKILKLKGLRTIDSLTAYIDYGMSDLDTIYFTEIDTKLEEKFGIVTHPIFLGYCKKIIK